MSQRRYGPVQGAGTQITEKDAEKTITPSAFGVTVHVGAYQRGTVGALNFVPKKKQFLSRMGGRIDNTFIAPDAALDFYDLSEGAGELWCVRVTDGNQVAASEYLYSRRIPRSAVVKVTAHDGGQWGGKRGFVVGEIASATVGTTTSLLLTETTLATGKTMLKDYWKGATLKLAAVPTKSYEVVSNTVAGVVTVIGDATLLTDHDGGGATDEYTLDLGNGDVGLSVIVHDGTLDPTNEWGVDIYWCGVLEKSYDNLSSNPVSAHYFVRAINDDTGNFSVTVQDLWTGGYAADVRPSNHYEQLVTLSDTAAKVEILQVQVNSPGGGNAAVGAFAYGQLLKAQMLTLTFSDATTFDVSSDKFGVLAEDVAVGDLFAPDFGESYVPGFVVTAGTSAMAEDDTITILVRPLVPNELVGGVIYPDKAGSRRTFYVIIANTVDTVTVKADSDMTSVADAGTKATITGTVAAATYNTSTNRTFKLTVDGGEEVTVSLTQGATTPIATLVSDINTAVGATVATVTAGGYIKLTSTIGGRFSKLVIGNGNANSVLGFTDSRTYAGVVGDCAMLQWPQQLGGGYDGLADLADADYEAMYDVDSSPIKRLWGKHKGLVKLGTPGVTATSVQKAGAAFAEAMNYQYRYEVPANITTEDSAEEYVNETLGRSDFAVVAFPSFAYVANPVKNSVGLKIVSTTGAIHGREAKMAKAWGGYHKAAAGEDVTLPSFLSLPTGDAVLDEEILNPQGLQVLKFVNGNLIVWGDRTVSADPTWRWKHQREQMSHYENILRENFGWIIFAINDVETWAMAWSELDKYFAQEVVKRALVMYNVKIDSENNTLDTMAEGDTNVDIRLKIVDTVERLRVNMSKVGIFEDVV